MTLEISTVPCLADNYAFIAHNPANGETDIVDAPDALPIKAFLDQQGWRPGRVFLTHHHDDHVAGVAGLRKEFGCRVVGAAADAHRLPPLDDSVADGETVSICGIEAKVLAVSGHTIGHIAFALPGAAFTGDSLMACGCGRLFEGNAQLMWESLSRIAQLPPDTLIYSGHEYAAANADFALSIEPANQELVERRDRIVSRNRHGLPNVPSLLSEELATNPFLRAGHDKVKHLLAMEHASDSEVFAELRMRKDRF